MSPAIHTAGGSGISQLNWTHVQYRLALFAPASKLLLRKGDGSRGVSVSFDARWVGDIRVQGHRRLSQASWRLRCLRRDDDEADDEEIVDGNGASCGGSWVRRLASSSLRLQQS